MSDGVVTPPQVVPLTDAPSQIVNVTLGGQVCQINVYTKSINRPIQPPGDIPVVPIQTATFNGALFENTLNVTAIDAGGSLGIGSGIFAADPTPPLPGGVKIREFLTGTGGVGTYSVYPGTLPVDAKGNYVPDASITGSIAGTILTVTNVARGVVTVGQTIRNVGIASGTIIVSAGNALGTYNVNISQNVPSRSLYLTFAPTISGSMVAYTTSGPTYENTNPVFLDLLVNDAPIISGVVLKNESLVVMDPYLGFIGDLAIVDTSGRNEDPFGVPPTLPNPPDLRNWWQRNVPLSLGGKAPPGVAGRIPGLGTRYLLTYWPNLR